MKPMKLYSHQGALIIIGIGAGLWLGTIHPWFLKYGGFLIKGGLFILLLSMMVTTSFESLRKAARNARFFGTALSMNFVIIPVLAFIIGTLFAKDEPQILLGMVMYLVTPCTDWFLSFTQRARGDEALGMLLLPWNLLLQVLLLPLYILLIVGEGVNIKLGDFIPTLTLFIFLPFIFSRIVRFLLRWNKQKAKLSKFFLNLQTGSLTLVVLFMFAVTGKEVMARTSLFPKVFVAVAVFLLVVFFLTKAVARAVSLNRGEYVLLNFTASARNSPIALAIALGAFPDQSLTAAVIILAPLVELPALSIEARILGLKNGG
jgi:ACR3 family arsenite efflux pump ArsB